MKIVERISPLRFLAQVIFLLLPTIAIVLFLLWNTTQYLSLLREQWFTQGLYFAIGLIASFLFHQLRFRFVPVFALLLFVLYSIYKILDNYTFSEFDGFFITVQFQVFAILFVIGWICGWAYERVSYAAILVSGLVLFFGIYLISKTGEITPYKLLSYFSPVALFAIYSIYTQTSLKQLDNTSGLFWIRYLVRMAVFVGVLLLLFRGVVYFMYPEIKERVAEFGGQSKEGEGGMLKQNKDGTSENKESMGLDNKNNKKNNPEPLFCAHIDHSIPGTDIPNPLYLTSYHFSKFDSITETFERDTLFRFNDEFIPDPSKIPLFFTLKDSSKLANAFATKMKKTVEVEIYKKRLSPSAFIAPSTSFFVQPITVEKEFQTTFTSAYRAKSYVSDLNSAYFIYNTEDPNIKFFQEQRFEELRKAKSYASVNPEFLKYYTSFSSGGIFQPVKKLADSLARGKTTTIDKVLAIRDYFLQRNELGEKVFKYTDNPGVPGLPGASKLLYFMFESKKGYCAYYAAATVFLLRSMNVPSRVVTGFLTVDRSDKNKGWYWFYEDQSHGWVQVYFPEYGWIDFDTTVGNDDAQQSPTPDGTPPLQPPQAILAAKGVIQKVDTVQKEIDLLIEDLIFKDVEFKKVNSRRILDVSITNIWKDSLPIPLRQLKTNDQIMAVSYAEKLKAIGTEKNFSTLEKKFPSRLPIDGIFIKLPDEIKKNELTAANEKEKFGIWYYVQRIMAVVVSLLTLLFFFPYLTLLYFKYRMRRSKKKDDQIFYAYQATTYYLHQCGIERFHQTMYQYATKAVDPAYQLGLTAFMNIYLKHKYANQTLSDQELQLIRDFYDGMRDKLHSKISRWKRVQAFMNLPRYFRFFGLTEEDSL